MHIELGEMHPSYRARGRGKPFFVNRALFRLGFTPNSFFLCSFLLLAVSAAVLTGGL